MDSFWIVTYDGEVESHWIGKRDIVVDYIDSKPSLPGKGRNSIDAYGKWKLVPIHVFSSLEEKTSHEQNALRTSGMEKLTEDEAKALGLNVEQEDETL